MEKLKFDVEKAKSGYKVVTRAGQDARILCYDYTLIATKKTEYIIAVARDMRGSDHLIIAGQNGMIVNGYAMDDDLFLVKGEFTDAELDMWEDSLLHDD